VVVWPNAISKLGSMLRQSVFPLYRSRVVASELERIRSRLIRNGVDAFLEDDGSMRIVERNGIVV